MGSYKNRTRKILHLSRTLIGLALQPWRNQTCLISYILYSTRLEAVGWERIGLVQAPPISTLQGSHYVRFFYCVYGGHSRGKPPTFLCPTLIDLARASIFQTKGAPIVVRMKQKVPLRIELRLSESKSDVITITPWNLDNWKPIWEEIRFTMQNRK